ncbi:DUF4139 domain-containing protein [Thermococcus sp.]|uniref:DUF4139 domain-containing protein n=1 Tax=Thermococcus sp. TaxID=35749 RepID=UPI00262E7BBF|nr:DUF4139 domain-containing protein [Thermococcus sp.]
MRKKGILAVAGALIILFAVFTFHSESAVSSNTTVVLYNSAKIGVVEEVKGVELEAGLNDVPLEELAGLDVAEAVVRPLDKGVEVLGIFARNPTGTYSANVGSEVEVKLKDGETISGKFLGLKDGKIAIEGDGYYLIEPGEVVYFKVRKLGEKGSVYAVLKAEKAGKYRVSITYRVDNMGWESRYRLYLGEEAELQGYVVINNPTALNFKGAKVLLVAGSVQFYGFQPRILYAKAESTSEVQVGQPEKVEAFYLYRLGIVDLKASSTSVYPYVHIESPFERQYLYESWAYSRSGPVYESVSFKTDKVLPAGVVEIYRETEDGPLLIGETRIGHTPKGDTVRIGVGRDYDLRGTTTVLEERHDDGKAYYKIRITIENFGNETKTVIVRHHKRGKLISSTVEPLEETADYVEFQLTVKPGEKKEIVFDYASSS